MVKGVTKVVFLLLLLLTGCGIEERADEEIVVTPSSVDVASPQIEVIPVGTYISYYDQLNEFMRLFMEGQTDYASIIPEYFADVTNDESVVAYMNAILNLSVLFRSLDTLLPPPDFNETHQELVEIGSRAADILEQLYQMLEHGMDFTKEETTQRFTELCSENVETASYLVEHVFQIGEQLKKSMEK